MEVKLFEVRDLGTFIPVLGVLMNSEERAEKYLLGRVGFSNCKLVQLVWLTEGKSEWDSYKWNDRTMSTAHEYIYQNWAELKTGAVVDVQTILGETLRPKFSERFTHE